MQVPTASVGLDTGAALNHCKWHQSGHSIAAADDMGRIYIHDVAEVSWKIVNAGALTEVSPFPHTTILQKTTLKIYWQKCEISHK